MVAWIFSLVPIGFSFQANAAFEPPELGYCVSPICFMYVWLSQKRYSSSITPSFQWPTVHIGSLNALPVGGIDLPSPVGIGFVKVPSITPMTLVQSPEPNLTGWTLMRVS